MTEERRKEIKERLDRAESADQRWQLAGAEHGITLVAEEAAVIFPVGLPGDAALFANAWHDLTDLLAALAEAEREREEIRTLGASGLQDALDEMVALRTRVRELEEENARLRTGLEAWKKVDELLNTVPALLGKPEGEKMLAEARFATYQALLGSGEEE